MKRIILAAIAGLFVSTVAVAQDGYPNRVVKVIVPYTPGGITDVCARIVAGGPVALAWAAVHHRKSPRRRHRHRYACGRDGGPDGYTLLMGTTVLSINPSLIPNLRL